MNLNNQRNKYGGNLPPSLEKERDALLQAFKQEAQRVADLERRRVAFRADLDILDLKIVLE